VEASNPLPFLQWSKLFMHSIRTFIHVFLFFFFTTSYHIAGSTSYIVLRLWHLMSKCIVALYYNEENDNNNISGLANIFRRVCNLLCILFITVIASIYE
jgi:hypothetical protein